MNSIVLKTGREKSLLRRHPWIFSGTIAEERGSSEVGETVRVLSAQGDFLAWGAYSPKSQIRVRVWGWDEAVSIDESFFYTRLDNAIQLRRSIAEMIRSNAMRLVHAESDGIPGLVVDQYGEGLVVQFLSSGVEHWRKVIVDILRDLTQVEWIFERSDIDVRELEGLPSRKGSLYSRQGQNSQGVPLDTQITEGEWDFRVDFQRGQKTGFYLDQRANRAWVGRLAKGRQVLDCFCYTGGFTINAMAGGAKDIIAIDSSEGAIHFAQENLKLNDFTQEHVQFIVGDVFQQLRTLRDHGQSFDMIVLDPPKFAPTVKQAQRAARGYKDINLLAFKLLNPGGLLVTFSCSGGVQEELFQKIVTGAALDAGVDAVILARLHQDIDHPVSLSFPEGNYLKGFIITRK